MLLPPIEKEPLKSLKLVRLVFPNKISQLSCESKGSVLALPCESVDVDLVVGLFSWDIS